MNRTRGSGTLLIVSGNFNVSLRRGGVVHFNNPILSSTDQEEIGLCVCVACTFSPLTNFRSPAWKPALSLEKFNPLKVVHVWEADSRYAPESVLRRREMVACLRLGAGNLCGIFSSHAKVSVATDDDPVNGRLPTPSACLFLFSSGPRASITFGMLDMPNRTTNLILMSHLGGHINVSERAFSREPFESVQAVQLGADTIVRSIVPGGIYCQELVHYSDSLTAIHSSVRKLIAHGATGSKNAMFYENGTWTSLSEHVSSSGSRYYRFPRERASDGYNLDGFVVGNDSDEDDDEESESEHEELDIDADPPPYSELWELFEEDPDPRAFPEEGDEEEEGEIFEALLGASARLRREASASNKRKATFDQTAEILLEQKRPAPNEALCVVCQANQRTHLIFPCGHAVYCDECYRNPQLDRTKCPVCKTEPKLVLSEEMHAKLSSMVVYW